MYKVWKVYDTNIIEFYVVNTVTHQVQSAWMHYLDASKTCSSLNKRS